MTARDDLVLLTDGFPYGDRLETFLEPEIEVLAERFATVFLLPSRRDPGERPLPPNVRAIEMGWMNPGSRDEKVRALASGSAASVLLETLRRRSNWRPYLSWWRSYLDILATNLLKARELAAFVRRRRLERAIFCDYWFENSTLALALVRRSGLISTAVSRAHHFDVYDELWEGRPVPFREFKARWLDLILPVSEHGAAYLRERIGPHGDKVKVCPLGVSEQVRPATPAAGGSPSEGGEAPLIVSCSRLVSHKRVAMIPQVLARCRRPVRWVHFGDGPDRDPVERAAAQLPDSVEWELRGQVANREMLAYYRAHEVALLLSLSRSEGIPVSMMEAQSFGIPIVATVVNGVPEIVTPSTGVPLAPEATVDEISTAVGAALEPGRFDREEILQFFRGHYEAETTHNRFADLLIALKENRSPAPGSG